MTGHYESRYAPKRPDIDTQERWWLTTDRGFNVTLYAFCVVSILALVVIQLNWGGDVVVATALAVPPLIVSLFFGPTATAYMALFSATALFGVSSVLPGDWSMTRGIGAAVLLMLSVANSALRVRREAEALRMEEVAGVAQSTILRPLPPRLGSVELAGGYVSAADGALVGGDLYDAVQTKHGVRILVGDVRGKGLEAVTLSATALWAFRSAGVADSDLRSVAAEVERALLPALGEEDFVTAVFASLTPDGCLEVASYGHPAPILLRKNGELETLSSESPAPPLGLALGKAPKVETYRVEVGDRLLLYTDGLIEARNADGDFYPLADHAAELLSGSPLGRAVDDVLEAVTDFTDTRFRDDLAVVLAERAV